MVETNDNFESKEQLVLENTQQSCLVKDGKVEKVTKKKSSPPEDEGVKKMLQLLRDHGYPTDESSAEEEPINWTAPL